MRGACERTLRGTDDMMIKSVNAFRYLCLLGGRGPARGLRRRRRYKYNFDRRETTRGDELAAQALSGAYSLMHLG
eukprot:752935-Prymnesium_polylepis.1